MARIDSHQGRATSDFETSRMFEGMQGWQKSFGDWVDYYRLDRARTTWDEVYEEVTGPGRIYQTPIRLACQHVTLLPGAQQWDDKGGYYSNALRAVIAYDTYTQSGMVLADIDTGKYQFDRIVYKNKVYRVTNLDEEGQIEERETVVAIDALQMKADELVEDQQFADYANRPMP